MGAIAHYQDMNCKWTAANAALGYYAGRTVKLAVEDRDVFGILGGIAGGVAGYYYFQSPNAIVTCSVIGHHVARIGRFSANLIGTYARMES